MEGCRSWHVPRSNAGDAEACGAHGHRGATDYGTEHEAIREVARKLGIGPAETLRQWVRREQVDAGQRQGITSEESAEIKRLPCENAELRRANEILEAVSAFSASELDRPQTRQTR